MSSAKPPPTPKLPSKFVQRFSLVFSVVGAVGYVILAPYGMNPPQRGESNYAEGIVVVLAGMFFGGVGAAIGSLIERIIKK